MDPEAAEVQKTQVSDISRKFDTDSQSPQESFSKFVKSLSNTEETDLAPGIINLAAQVFNDERKREPQNNVELFYHFTDNTGAHEITQTGVLGNSNQERIYLTKVEPGKAVPLLSTEDAKDFEAFLKGEKIPQNLREHFKKFILDLKFKWRHGVVRRLGNMVPVGEHKLENVMIIATNKTSEVKLVKKDEHGELYVDNPINLEGNSTFQVFGPYPSKMETPHT